MPWIDDMSEHHARAVITLSASYGSGGSRVGPRLAQRLGVPFIDRAIPAAVSARLGVSFDDALAREEPEQGTLARLFGYFAPAIALVPAALPPEAVPQTDQAFLATTEQVLREYAASGAIILGRAGAVILGDVEHVLRVRLDGPRERRVAQAMRLESLDQTTAEARLDAADRARDAYVRHWYHVDPRDPSLYHLMIDSTAIDLDACVELIALASISRTSAPPEQASD